LAAGYSVDETIYELISGETGSYDPDDFAAALLNPANRGRFVVVEAIDELSSMLEAPLEKWRVFLHPTQEKLIHAHFSGPTLVTGGPGTGKTVVAMHRAKYLAKQLDSSDKKILFTTFSANLAQYIKTNLSSLCLPDTFGKIEVTHLHSWATRFLREQGLRFGIPTEKQVLECWQEAVREAGDEKWGVDFCREEWETVIQYHGIESLEEYLSVVRSGRGISLNGEGRKQLFEIFQLFIAAKERRNFLEWNDVLERSRQLLSNSEIVLPYTTVIVDEAQDMEPGAFRLLRAIVPEKENDLFIVGDVHQRIYKRPVVLSHCGIFVRGRSRNLKLNYRTTDQIGKWSLHVLNGLNATELNGDDSSLKGYHSLLKGVDPIVENFSTLEEEETFLVEKIKMLLDTYQPESICLLARKKDLLEVYKEYLEKNGILCRVLDKDDSEQNDGRIRLATMHRVKGLEFTCVFILSANEGIIPRSSVIKGSSDPMLCAERLEREKALLFVAATRARDLLFVTSYGEPSRFLRN
jgi:superfamily I DNA/RNA helicase